MTVHDLAVLRELVAPTSLGGERIIEVCPELRELFPRGGPTAGSVVSIEGAGATSMLWSMLAHPTTTRHWVALVGMESMGWAAAVEAGVDLDQVVVVQRPPSAKWATVVAALIDGFDVLVVSPTSTVRAGEARRLTSRLRERGGLLICHGATWPERPDVVLTVDRRRWQGLGAGHGHLRDVSVHMCVTGRRAAARPRAVELALVS